MLKNNKVQLANKPFLSTGPENSMLAKKTGRSLSIKKEKDRQKLYTISKWSYKELPKKINHPTKKIRLPMSIIDAPLRSPQ